MTSMYREDTIWGSREEVQCLSSNHRVFSLYFSLYLLGFDSFARRGGWFY
jgi:hypothetical protein